MVSLSISIKGKPSITVDFPGKRPDKVTVKEVKAAVEAKFPQLVANRQRLKLPVSEGKPVALTDESRTIGSYGVKEGSQLQVKDLGRQIEYRVLYLWEYAGPIFLNPLFVQFSFLLWGKYDLSTLQVTYRNLTVFHFIKRFLESAFVHDFSRATVPLSYVYRNCLYYWGINGILIGLTLYRPAYSAQALKGSILDNPNWIRFWTVFILINEFINFLTHLHLRTLRTPPGQPRKFPTGLGFDQIVCANYFWETLQVIGMVVMSGFDLGNLVYISIATYFMGRWAGQKYRRYKKEFDPKVYPGKRWKMFPFIY
ncbi:3-oxo-5a-steroid 4- dehydrogenase [Saitozyma podzolica]|uniref:3-oxo-5a-steroid 4-dehydrogenase n=1 Tax=Saitozyma podzolica TaxID=1890683 RepID=A0A427YQR5_9TREE|nr:3-oxo-5a-steroid 4- dehydrogenase [Saitozyma podzolica]